MPYIQCMMMTNTCLHTANMVRALGLPLPQVCTPSIASWLDAAHAPLALFQVVAARGEGAGSARQLLALSRCVNQAVGDALSGVLLVEAALRSG